MLKMVWPLKVFFCAGKTAYGVAGNKEVRDAFRRYMAEAPDQWDWAAADVPSALTPEMDQHHQAKEVGKVLPSTGENPSLQTQVFRPPLDSMARTVQGADPFHIWNDNICCSAHGSMLEPGLEEVG